MPGGYGLDDGQAQAGAFFNGVPSDERLEDHARGRGRQAGTAIAHRDQASITRMRDFDPNKPWRGVTARIFDERENGLPDAKSIAVCFDGRERPMGSKPGFDQTGFDGAA